jgi:cyclophilin family peptidyl-prolyl cis-trans isomerase
MAIKQQAGIGLGICGDHKGWSGGSTRTDGEASQPQALKEKRPKVFLEIELHKRKLGRIVLELFGDVVPVTVENFRCLCTGEKGASAVSGKPLHYKGCRFHKIIPGKFVQGGDIVHGNGRGGDSIYNQDGDACFPDESFKLKHDRPALISMSHRNGEAGKNASQFFFTSAAAPKLDGKHVVFGRIIQGVDILSKLESSGTPSGKPLFESIISDCGEIESEAMKTRKRKFKEEPLPPGWEEKESRNKPGLKYYVHESGATQFERPTTRARDPLAVMAENAKVRRLEAEREKKNNLEALPTRAVEKGERRIWHILKKHKDFFGKPASSWRQKEITWSQKDAKAALLKIRDKLENIGYGGGPEALQRKFENYARLESDDDISAKAGGDLGPITKRKVLFGGPELAKAAFELEQGKMADIVSTKEGVHLVARFE